MLLTLDQNSPSQFFLVGFLLFHVKNSQGPFRFTLKERVKNAATKSVTSPCNLFMCLFKKADREYLLLMAKGVADVKGRHFSLTCNKMFSASQIPDIHLQPLKMTCSWHYVASQRFTHCHDTPGADQKSLSLLPSPLFPTARSCTAPGGELIVSSQ